MLRKELAVVVALAAIFPTWAATPGPLPPPDDRELAHDILRELISINTTHEHGSTEAARVIQQQLLAAGFAQDDLTFIAPPDKPAKGNVIVRYRAKTRGGKGPSPVLFLGHLDVVEAR